MHTKIIPTHDLACFVPLFLQIPCPSYSIFYLPTESHEVSESFAITVCIYRQQCQDPACVYMCESVRVCVWVHGCLEVTLPKTRDPESNDSPPLPDTATRRADITCPKTKSYSSL